MFFWNRVLVIISLITLLLGTCFLGMPVSAASLPNYPMLLTAIKTPGQVVDASSIVDSSSLDPFRQGIKATGDGRYFEALQFFTQAIASEGNPSPNPSNNRIAAAYANRCLVEIQLNQYQSAIEDCTQAIARQPGNGEAYLDRGLAQYRLGHYQAAIADNNQLLTLQPNDLRAYFNRGLAKARLADHEGAIADYQAALERQPASSIEAEIYIDKGLSIAALSDLSGAITDLDHAIALNSTNDRAFYNRGCIHRQQGDYLAAIQDLDRALQLNSILPEAHVDRAIAYYNLGNANQALHDLQQATEYFQLQGKKLAYQQTLNLMQQIRRSLNTQFLVG
jgi:tetratricopeptide (TPR) repeat protein